MIMWNLYYIKYIELYIVRAVKSVFWQTCLLFYFITFYLLHYIYVFLLIIYCSILFYSIIFILLCLFYI